MTDTSPRALAADPEWLPHTYDVEGQNLTFVHVPRQARDKLMFLVDEHYKGQYLKATRPATEIAAAMSGLEPAPLHFIFHTSFCCSTLLVKALDIPGQTVGLKEPDVLIHLANRFIRSGDAANKERLALVLRLLARPFDAGETVIVKPSNFANRLILPALAPNPESRAVLLYSDLPTLLRSLLKRGMWGRIWGRQLYRNLIGWTALNFGYSPVETFDQTDLQIAGLSWLMQIHHFQEAARQLGRDRVMIVNSADFTADTATVLGGIADFFGLGLHRETLEEIAGGPVFSRHSKLAQLDYSVDVREQDHAAADAAHGEEIDMVVKWVEAVAGHLQVPLQPKVPAAA